MRYHEFKWRQGCGGRLSQLDGDVFRHRRDCRPNPNGCRQHDDGDARTSYFAHVVAPVIRVMRSDGQLRSLQNRAA
jgi:hypothetical protein